MRYMTSKEIRETWLSFFKQKNHEVVESASLIPKDDKTLLWVNAGVTPLKKFFDGTLKPSNNRLTNIQKCIRTNDIENVGKTARHHTFFEMLGNFSIGDYFKEEAINFGFELLTSEKYFAFPKDKLYITYYYDDLDAKNYWLKLGVKENHLIPMESNFWEIGPGPSGPDTEIYFDRGEEYDKRGAELIANDIDNERFIEIWNIVFSQYNAKPGEQERKDYQELPSKNIDTGAGLERFACVLQNTKTNFETDLFYPIIKEIEDKSKVTYKGQMAFKVIADHIKTLTFAISDGAILANEGRGYVLRRILRRAIKHGRTLGFNEPFLYTLVKTVVKMMKEFYPNLKDMQKIVEKIIFKEEEKFLETIAEGEKHLIEALKNEGSKLSGKTAFKLYDTYGFPIELTIEYSNEHNATVDLDSFNLELKLQKERSRGNRKEQTSMKGQNEEFLSFKKPSLFVGYDKLETNSKVIKVFNNGIVFDKTPFYATSGGQLKDKGTINDLLVLDVIKLPNGQHLHVLEEHNFKEGDECHLKVCTRTRHQIEKNHSTAHLFHQAIKDIIGPHANQHGQQISDKTWRFDFNHYEGINDETILKIEDKIKHYIKDEPLDVNIYQTTLENAKKIGAIALFGEKYGKEVRVVDMNYSIELCGGTHVKNTSEINDALIVSIESIGSGIFRATGLSGKNLDWKLAEQIQPLLDEIAKLESKILEIDKDCVLPKKDELQYSYRDIINYRKYFDSLKDLIKELQKANKELEQKKALSNLENFDIDYQSKRQVVVLENIQSDILKHLVDTIYDKINGENLFVINKFDNRLIFVAKSQIGMANTLMKLALDVSLGKGGGNPSFSQGSTSNTNLLDAVIKAIKEKI